MKKLAAGVLSAVGAVILGYGIFGIVSIKKAVSYSYSVIGSADGPTSVFIAGKVGDGLWWTLIAIGGAILGLAVALLVAIAGKSKK